MSPMVVGLAWFAVIATAVSTLIVIAVTHQPNPDEPDSGRCEHDL